MRYAVLAFLAIVSATGAMAADPPAQTAPAGAPQTAAPADSQGSQPPKPEVDPNELVCKSVAVTGSRLAKKRVCRTRAQIAADAAEDKRNVRDVLDRPRANVQPASD